MSAPCAENLAQEIWRPVPDAPSYEVSSLGQVRSVDRTVCLSNGRTRTAKGVVLRSFTLGDEAYRYVSVHGKTRAVHQLVLETFVGPRPGGHEVLHGNDVPDDNRLANLRWGTRSENVQDCLTRGRHHKASQTLCAWGHLLAPPNLVQYLQRRGGQRLCRACHRTRATARRAQARGAQPIDFQATSDQHFANIMAAHGGVS